MRHLKIAVFLVSITALAIAPACGGGGRGFRVPSNPLTLDSTVLPTLLSGQNVEYALPIGGGCGGPYILNLIDGELPEGITLDDREQDIEGPGVPAEHRRHIVGIALEDGIFQGTIEIIDTACNPFASMRFDFNWQIGRGPVQIVAANPELIPAAEYVNQEPSAYPDVDAIQPVIFNQFGSINLIAAGGIPPYSCTIIDDPLDPDDGPLPLGTSMPPNSCSIVGSPVQVGPNGNPFRITVRVTDSVNATATKKFQWKIRTPPIVFGTLVLSDGIAGQNYGEVLQVADGVPPFNFEWDLDLPDPNDNTSDLWTWAGGTTAPTIPGITVTNTGPSTTRVVDADYPGDMVAGPYGAAAGVGAAPPEGIVLTNIGSQAGTFAGVPRRIGTFTVHSHIYSELVPNENGQHGWMEYTFTIADSESAPIIPFSINPEFTVQKTLDTMVGDTYPDLPEFSFNAQYNPDSTSHLPSGLQMLGEGGVPIDGNFDRVNSHDAAGMPIALQDSNEVAGTYEWSVVDWNPLGGNDPIATIDLQQPPAGAGGPAAGAFSDGVINTSDPSSLVRQSRQVVEFLMQDMQLPLQSRHEHQQRFGLSVGPDVVIITESAQSMSATTRTGFTNIDMHDDQLYVRKLQVIAGQAQLGPLSAQFDMALTHSIPADAPTGAAPDLDATNPLGSLLSRFNRPAAPLLPAIDPYSLDLLRVVVNPGGWWDDVHGMNPKAARPMSHTGPNTGQAWVGTQEDSYPGHQPTAAAVALPDTLIHSPATGVYGNGGKLYAFETENHFGVFVIRQDGKIYVPYAARKNTYTGFGDGMIADRGPDRTDISRSNLRTVQMAVSPNGRYAALKLKSNHLNLGEPASQSAVVVFTLDGAKDFAGQTYRVMTSGYVGTMPAGSVLYSSSMVMTDRFVYFLIGEDGTSTTLASWQDHYIMRAPILAGNPVPANGLSTAWTQDAATGTAMQTPFHHWSSPTSTISTFTFSPTFSQITITVTNNDRYSYDGFNFTEQSIASVPFRVSADGTTCCVLAGTATTATNNSSAIWAFHAWADRLGAGFQQASSTTRKARAGASRPHVLRRGANSYRHWGNYEGPSGGFEVSNDGSKIAYTYSTVGTVNSIASSTSHNLGLNRQDLVAIETGDSWATGADDLTNNVDEHTVTADKFQGTHLWKFGGLAFGKQNDKLFFWGGASRRGPTTSDSTTTSTTAAYAQWAGQQTGTLYMFDFGTPTEVKSILATGDGGTGMNTYTSSSTFAPSTSPPTYDALGDIAPVGGFTAKSQDFYYRRLHRRPGADVSAGCHAEPPDRREHLRYGHQRQPGRRGLRGQQLARAPRLHAGLLLLSQLPDQLALLCAGQVDDDES